MGGESRAGLGSVEGEDFTGLGNSMDMGDMSESLTLKWIMVPEKNMKKMKSFP